LFGNDTGTRLDRCCERKQVIKDRDPECPPLGFDPASFARPQQSRRNTRAPGGLEVPPVVAHHERLTRPDPGDLDCRGDEAGGRLAAGTASLRCVRAVEHRIEWSTHACRIVAHASMNRFELLQSHQPATDARLIRSD
jgi:hypothetical protein